MPFEIKFRINMVKEYTYILLGVKKLVEYCYLINWLLYILPIYIVIYIVICCYIYILPIW